MASATVPGESTSSLPSNRSAPVHTDGQMFSPQSMQSSLALRVELSEWGGSSCDALGSRLSTFLAALKASPPADPQTLAMHAGSLREMCEIVECGALHAAGSVGASVREKLAAEESVASARELATAERERISTLREKLDAERGTRKRRREYESLAAVVAKNSDCGKSAENIAAIEKEITLLRRKEARLKQRKKNMAEEFALFLTCVEDLEKSIQGDTLCVNDTEGDVDGECALPREDGEVEDGEMAAVAMIDVPSEDVVGMKTETGIMKEDTVMTTN